MDDLLHKWQLFWHEFAENGAWKRVLGEGLVNTLMIAIIGLLMGIVIGTLIASVRVMPKYKRSNRFWKKIRCVIGKFFAFVRAKISKCKVLSRVLKKVCCAISKFFAFVRAKISKCKVLSRVLKKVRRAIGKIFAFVRAMMPKYALLPRILDKICGVYVGFFRGTPIVVQLLMAYYVIFPLCGINIGSLATCILVFGLNSGAYVSEIMRSGIQSVDIGQMEAGRALGMSFASTMMRIIVPQAVKNILPTLGNELIALVKETSVVSFVAAVDIYKTFTDIGNVRYEYLMPYLFMALIYIVLVALISLGVKWMERSLRKSDRSR